MSRVVIEVTPVGYVLRYHRGGVEVRVPLSRSKTEAEMLAEAVAATLFS